MSKYDDIIDMRRPVSKRGAMSIEARAAQFAPFSALTGYSEAIKEVSRLTDDKKELDENEKKVIDEKLNIISENIDKMADVVFVHFVSDKKKIGGKYVRKSGIVKKIDMFRLCVFLMDGTTIPIEDILSIDSELFSLYNF